MKQLGEGRVAMMGPCLVIIGAGAVGAAPADELSARGRTEVKPTEQAEQSAHASPHEPRRFFRA